MSTETKTASGSTEAEQQSDKPEISHDDAFALAKAVVIQKNLKSDDREFGFRKYDEEKSILRIRLTGESDGLLIGSKLLRDLRELGFDVHSQHQKMDDQGFYISLWFKYDG